MHLFYLTLILLSSAGLILLLASKLREAKTGEGGALARLSRAGDPLVRRSLAAGSALYALCNANNAEKVWRRGAESLFHLCGTAGLFISRQYGRLKGAFNGKRLPTNRGAVSFFLKSVAESKGDGKNQESRITNQE